MVEKAGGKQPEVAGIEELGKIVKSVVDQIGPIFWKLIDLAKTNPLWGGILGLIIDDALSHYGTHPELVCLDCTTPATAPENLPPLANPIENWAFVSVYDWLTGKSAKQHEGHHLATVKVPGLISSATNLQVAGLVLSAFAVSEAGAIITDITNISKLVGASGDPASIVKPSVTTLVETGTNTQVGVYGTKSQ